MLPIEGQQKGSKKVPKKVRFLKNKKLLKSFENFFKNGEKIVDLYKYIW